MPKIVDHEERRREFAAAAMRVAIAQGVDALTVRSVAREANCSAGALAHYFKTKDDLLIAVQRAASGASLRRIDACFERFTGRELLEQVVLSVLPLDDERRGEWRLWLAYFARAAEVVDLARVQQDYYRDWRSQLRRAYQAALEGRASQTRAEVELAGDALMALIQGLGVLGMYEPSNVGARRLRRLVQAQLDRWLP